MSEIDSRSDKTQVALSIEGNDHIEYLTKVFKLFADGQDAYRVSVALSLSRGFVETDLSPVHDKKTKYGIGTLDESGALRDLICLLRPDLSSRPYAASEWLAEMGLFTIRNEYEEGKTLTEILTS
jgi:hypothetical protein